mgnify:CR=1 FL=1
MFLDFLELLRLRGLDVSLNEWLTVVEGLYRGLHGSSLDGFYYLCRAAVVKTETDYDRFDQAFTEFFKDLPWDEISEEMEKWLTKSGLYAIKNKDILERMAFTDQDIDEIEKGLEKRLKIQDSEHDGGRLWVGTQGFTPYGNHGEKLGGVRVGGSSAYRSAYRVAGERKFRDWRDDNTIDSRLFQMAFRRLRQLSRREDQEKTELDIDETIDDTCDNGGILNIVYRRPRRNTLKLLILIDSGGSMSTYEKLCSLLFQSLNKVNTFASLKIYYYHNTIRRKLYLDPTIKEENSIDTEWVFKNISTDYRVIIVGDAECSMDELLTGLDWNHFYEKDRIPGIYWYERIKKRYPHVIWLYPQPTPAANDFWSRSFWYLYDVFPMYQMSIKGMNDGMRKLMENR